MRDGEVLVTGATGYVGGRLVPLLLESGYKVRAMGRSLEKLRARVWADHPDIRLVQGDVYDPDSLIRAARGCWAAFYLVHSMNPQQKNFEQADRQAAQNMVQAAAQAGLDRMVYLGGLGEDSDSGRTLSKHLRSRHEVAEILQSGPVPTTFLRAAMILGSGSASFEVMRYLVDRVPVILAPPWVETLNQPIAIRNVLYYLRGCLESEAVKGETFDIGGPDVLTYKRLLELYAEEAGLENRRVIPTRLVNQAVISFWVHRISPVPAAVAVPLLEGLKNEVICHDHRIREIIPQDLLTCRETLRLALAHVRQEKVQTCWSDAGCLLPPEWTYCGDADYTGGTILECGYRAVLRAEPEAVWEPISKIGGDQGWYFGDLLWKIRGDMDRLLGGIGLRRGRRHSSRIMVGDALDFWRVLEVEPPTHLLLLAEMKLPGEALLDFQVIPKSAGRTEVQLLSRFVPHGLFGIGYWFSLYPFHQIIFGGMLRAIARSIKQPVLEGPKRFTPKIPDECRFL